MRTRKITFLLIGLILISSLSGYNTVICYGSDGHICVESVNHSHCDSIDENEHTLNINDIHSKFSDYLSISHSHCNDTLIKQYFYLTKSNQNNKLISKAASFYIKNINYECVSTNPLIVKIIKNQDISDFFIPLESIVILA